MSEAGAGSGAAPPPFQVSWTKLEGVFTQKVLNILKGNGLVAEHVKIGGDVVGLKVNGEDYTWFDIAMLWNKNELHDKWGVDQGILKELLEDGS